MRPGIVDGHERGQLVAFDQRKTDRRRDPDILECPGFVRGQIVVFDTGRRLSEAHELVQVLPQLSPGSVFYHVIDARSRAPQSCDDFSSWLRELPDSHDTLLARLADIDPYFVTLAELRQQYIDVITSHFGGASS